jgi:SAM-dependent methyltransferase
MENITYERYVETFHVLEKYSEEYGHQLQHLLRVSDSFKDGFSILDIGAGTGNFAASFFEKARVKAGMYAAIEPSEEHIEMIAGNLLGFWGLKQIIHGKFTAEYDFGRKFDLIIMSHSMYWFYSDLAGHLLNALNFLNAGGRLVVYLQAPATVSYILNRLFRDSDRSYPHWVSSRELTDVLEAHEIGYDIEYLPGTLSAGEIFRPENKRLMHDLISFFLFSEAKDMSPRDLKLAEDMLTMLSYPSGGDVKLNLAVAAITV